MIEQNNFINPPLNQIGYFSLHTLDDVARTLFNNQDPDNIEIQLGSYSVIDNGFMQLTYGNQAFWNCTKTCMAEIDFSFVILNQPNLNYILINF